MSESGDPEFVLRLSFTAAETGVQNDLVFRNRSSVWKFCCVNLEIQNRSRLQSAAIIPGMGGIGPAEFSSSTQTHLNNLIKVFRVTRATAR